MVAIPIRVENFERVISVRIKEILNLDYHSILLVRLQVGGAVPNP